MSRPLAICAVLLLATAALYAQTASFDFVALDDDIYVYDNPDLDGPLGLEGLAWAFAPEIRVANWHPITMWSLRLDASQVGRRDASRYHVVNALLHALATLLAFAALRALTGRDVESGLAALVFAVHPLHVESVAWVASRKDVLAGCGWWAAIACHARFARTRDLRACLAAIAAGAFALLSKPTAVALPFALLLFDFWPLARLGRASAARLMFEKIPLFALAAATSAVTLWAQSGSGAMDVAAHIPFGARLANAIVAYVRYVTSTFWPRDLALFYPYPGTLSEPPLGAAHVALAAIALAAISAFAVAAARRGFRSVLVGWLYFIGTLVPVIGLVQVGMASHADRYTYLSQMGLVVAVVFGASEWLRARHPNRLASAAAIGIAACLALGVAGYREVARWRDTPTLFESVLAARPRIATLHYNYANWLQRYGAALPGASERAERHYRAALAIDPNSIGPAVNLGLLLVLRGDRAEGMALLESAVERSPRHANANLDLGIALAQSAFEEGPSSPTWGRARRHLEAALAGAPPASAIERQRAHRALAGIAELEGDFARARSEWERAVELDPSDSVSALALARAVARQASGPDDFARARDLARASAAAAARQGDSAAARAAEELAAALDAQLAAPRSQSMEPPARGRRP